MITVKVGRLYLYLQGSRALYDGVHMWEGVLLDDFSWFNDDTNALSGSVYVYISIDVHRNGLISHFRAVDALHMYMFILLIKITAGTLAVALTVTRAFLHGVGMIQGVRSTAPVQDSQAPSILFLMFDEIIFADDPDETAVCRDAYV